MQIEIVKEYSPDDVKFENENFKRKYGSLEALQQRVSTGKCENPRHVDDYMLWEAMKSKNARVSEKIVFNTSDMFLKTTPRRMEMLEYLSTHQVESVRDLARWLKRDYKNVYDDARVLKELGLLSIIQNGRKSIPTTRVKKIVVALEGR